MVKTDSCGCVVQRKYASDYLTRRLYALNEKGFSLVKRVEIGDGRWFEVYKRGNDYRYKSSECPLVVITLEALLEAKEDGTLNKSNWREVLRGVKGLQINEVIERIGSSLSEVLS